MNNTNHCNVCDAVYSKDTQWVKGFASFRGTESHPQHFNKIADIGKNVCPICSTPDHVEVVKIQFT